MSVDPQPSPTPEPAPTPAPPPTPEPAPTAGLTEADLHRILDARDAKAREEAAKVKTAPTPEKKDVPAAPAETPPGGDGGTKYGSNRWFAGRG